MRDRIVIVDINTKKFKAVSYKQYDENNILQIVVTEYGRIIGLSSYSVTVHFQLPSGKFYSIPCIVENNTIKVLLTKTILSENGKVTVEIELATERQVITTFSIYLNVEKSINKEISEDVEDDTDVIGYQRKKDDALETEDKSIVGAINEVNKEIDDVNTQLENYATKEELENAIEEIDKNSNDITKILEIIDEPPIYVEPTLSIGLSISNVAHNVETNVIIIPEFTQNDAGEIISYSLNKNGNELYSNSSVNAYTDKITLQHGGTITYNAIVNYGNGVIKNTLLGIEYPETSIKEGNISNSAVVKGYALSYYGIIDNDTIDDLETLTSILRTSKSSTLIFNMVNQRVVYMYPKSFGNLTSIKDANNFDYINSYTLSNVIYNDIEYNVYILTDAVSINGFKQIFN